MTESVSNFSGIISFMFVVKILMIFEAFLSAIPFLSLSVQLFETVFNLSYELLGGTDVLPTFR